MTQIRTIVFDLGGVLIDWNPRHLYREFFDQEDQMEWFLNNVCNASWNHQMDAGKSFEVGVKELSDQFPEHKPAITAYWERWIDMISGPIEETVDLLNQVAEKDFGLFALTNWSHETFPLVRHEYDFFNHFQDILVSGEEKLAKPDPVFFQLMFERFKIEPESTLFIDDNAENVQTANKLRMHTVHFKEAVGLKKSFQEHGIL